MIRWASEARWEEGFPVETMRGKKALLIAGGLGIVPLRSLIVNILDEREDFDEVTILYGSKSPTTCSSATSSPSGKPAKTWTSG